VDVFRWMCLGGCVQCDSPTTMLEGYNFEFLIYNDIILACGLS